MCTYVCVCNLPYQRTAELFAFKTFLLMDGVVQNGTLLKCATFRVLK